VILLLRVVMVIRVIIRLDDLITRKMTGSSKKLASKLNISERIVYNYISFMISKLQTSVVYNYQKL